MAKAIKEGINDDNVSREEIFTLLRRIIMNLEFRQTFKKDLRKLNNPQVKTVKI
ncbi:MAG: hypothetical protein AB4058_12670 [Microcystaceae cyanobacterium]